MKVAHLCVLTPNRCGLHETTRELVAGLRERGIDSRLVDPFPEKNPIGFKGTEDRGVPIADQRWAKTADLLVSHSGLSAELDKTDIPFVLVAHGRPRSSFLIESKGGVPVTSYYARLNTAKRLRGVVTFWPQHYDYLRVLLPDKPIHVVQPSVDLGYWCPAPKRYGFNGKSGPRNIVISDPWRDDVDPYLPLNAFALWARTEKAKVHLYGRPSNAKKGWDALLSRIAADGNLGEVRGWVSGLREVYRSADAIFTGNEIDTRTVREGMACGCPVIRIKSDLKVGEFPTRESVRTAAEQRFNPKETARQFECTLTR